MNVKNLIITMIAYTIYIAITLAIVNDKESRIEYLLGTVLFMHTYSLVSMFASEDDHEPQ